MLPTFDHAHNCQSLKVEQEIPRCWNVGQQSRTLTEAFQAKNFSGTKSWVDLTQCLLVRFPVHGESKRSIYSDFVSDNCATYLSNSTSSIRTVLYTACRHKIADSHRFVRLETVTALMYDGRCFTVSLGQICQLYLEALGFERPYTVSATWTTESGAELRKNVVLIVVGSNTLLIASHKSKVTSIPNIWWIPIFQVQPPRWHFSLS